MGPVLPEQQPTETSQLRTLVLALLAVASLLLFLWLGEDVHTSRTQNVDNQVLARVHAWASPALTWLMLSITQLGSTPTVTTLAVVAVVVFLKVRWKRAIILLATDLAVALVLDTFLKDVFHRPRPQPFFGIPPPHTYSFPSGHALFSICLYGMLAALLSVRLEGRLWPVLVWTLAGLLVLAISFSRVYLGVHYPSDVLGGWAIAGAWISVVLSFDRGDGPGKTKRSLL
jgi:membrane-associated phospholipid phosphatase